MSPFLFLALMTGPVGCDLAHGVRAHAAAREVRRLGSPEYRVREAAGRELVRLGQASLGPLRAGEGDPDPERSTRCRAVRAQIDEGILAAKLAHLLARHDAPPPAGLPGLDQFLSAAGDSTEARNLYADIFRRFRPCLHALAERPDAVGELFREPCSRLDARLRRHRSTAADEDELRLRPAELAALLFFVGHMPVDQVSNDIDSAVNRVCYSKDAIDLLADRGPSRPLRGLLLGALRQHGSDGLREAILWPVGRCKIKEAAPVLIAVLGDPRINDFARGELLISLGSVGTRETAGEVRRMKALFESTAQVTSVQFPRDFGLPVMTTQLRDVAVGVCAELEGRDLGKLGFHPEPRKYYSDYPSVARYALIDEASRAEVHRRWRESQDTRRK